jgi:putative ABC transport system permease protein
VLANLQLGTAIMSFLGVLALLMGGFIIFNTFRTILAERKRDIGMLRAIGAAKSTISQMILWEELMQGLLGSLAGILVGWILGGVLVKGMQGLFSQYVNIHIAPPGFSLSLAGMSLAMGLGVTLLAGWLPARSAMRITPMDALRPSLGKVSFNRLLKPGFWVGLVMIVLAVAALLTRSTTWLGPGAFLLVVGLILATPVLIYPLATALGWVASHLFPKSESADLARNNLVRQPSRTANTASATMIGFAILVAAVSVVQSATIGFTNVLPKSLGSDLILMPSSVALWGTDIGASPQFAESIRALPSVKSVSSLRFAPVTINGSTVSVLGIDPVNFQQVSGLEFSKGDETAAYADLANSGTAFINPLLASSINKKVGETITLPTPTGSKDYRIVGLASDFLNAKIATIYVSMQSIEQDFNKKEDILLQIGLKDLAKKAEPETQIKGVMAAYPQFRLLVGADYLNENISLLKAATAGLLLMLVFLALPSLLAILNSMVVAVIERTREIGMLRAVGATRRQVRSMIKHEGIILALIGSILGIAAGIYLGYVGSMAMQALGYPMEYVFPVGTVLAALLIGLVFGILSSSLPSRQAARMNVVEALRYE